MMRSLAILLLTCWSATAATWFVDNAATGSNSGTSWANAWTSFASINWTSISAGDTIYISGGSTASSKTYTETLTIGKSGTSANRITIGVKADDASHNGTVILASNYIDANGINYVTVTGNVGGARHFRIRDFYDSVTGTFANGVLAPGSVGFKLDSIHWTNVNNCVDFSNAQNFWITNCLAQQIRGDALVRAQGCYGAGGYLANIVENSDWEVVVGPDPAQGGGNGGPDGIQTGNNLTARHNIFRVRQVNWYVSGQHCDMFQAPGVYLWIEGNEFYNNGDSGISLASWWNGAYHAHIRIINNLFHNVDGIDPFPEFFRFYNNNTESPSGPIIAVDDWLIANNTFIDNRTQNGYINASIAIAWVQTPQNFPITNVRVANNIFRNAGTPIYILDSPGLSAGGFTFDHNVYESDVNLRWRNTTYSSSAWSAIEPTRILGSPTFVSYSANNAANDYHLATNDVVALRKGADLSAYGFSTDITGAARVSGFWSIGAYESGSSGGVPPIPILPGLSWPATNGVITAPFSGSLGYVSQSVTTDDPMAGGRATYTFTNSAGAYRVKLHVNAPNGAANSVFIDFNQEPVSPTAIWDVISFTSGYEDRYSAWRGAGAFDNPEFPSKTWILSGGTNTLYIRGREPGMPFDQVTVDPVVSSPETPITMRVSARELHITR